MKNTDLKSSSCYIPSGYLKKQMGNARFLIARSTKSLEGYRLASKLVGLGRDIDFEEKKFTRVKVDEDKNKRWFLGDKRHRRDGPAVERVDGYKAWWVEGKRHRLDGPAIEYENGDKFWFVGGELHRVDGPAIEWDGDKIWFFEGKKHREDGPAVECADGSEEWWVDGRKLNIVRVNGRRIS